MNRTLIEAEWTKKILGGDAGSFEQLFNYYCQSLINFARRYVWDKQIAENIVQDIFVKVWTNRTILDPEKSIKSYLFTATKNESLKHLRHSDVEKRGIQTIVNSTMDESNPDKIFDTEDLEKKINIAIEKLPEKCREIFSMNRFDNLKYKEIASILNISVKTVETQMGRALKKLREELKFLMVIIIMLTSLIYLLL